MEGKRRVGAGLNERLERKTRTRLVHQVGVLRSAWPAIPENPDRTGGAEQPRLEDTTPAWADRRELLGVGRDLLTVHALRFSLRADLVRAQSPEYDS